MKELRLQLDEIDNAMRKLFEARLDVVTLVGQYKLAHTLEVLDSKREAEIIANGLSKLDNPDYADYYTQFLKFQMEISKDLQVKLIKNTDK